MFTLYNMQRALAFVSLPVTAVGRFSAELGITSTSTALDSLTRPDRNES